MTTVGEPALARDGDVGWSDTATYETPVRFVAFHRATEILSKGFFIQVGG